MNLSMKLKEWSDQLTSRSEAPGFGMRIIQINDIKLAIINLQGRALCKI